MSAAVVGTPQVLPAVGNPYGRSLTPEDYRVLSARWIDREHAELALLSRVTNFEGRDQVGERRRDCSGILIPYQWPGESIWHNVRIRRDNPEMENGKPKAKYMGAPGWGNKVYIMPGTDPALLSASAVPIIITEGEFKTIALERLANWEPAARRFLPIGLAGVWNWRGTIGKVPNEKGVRVDDKGVIPDLERIAWQGRRVIIAFDSDGVTNPKVSAAKYHLSQELRHRGAEVGLLEWEPSKGKGVDDWLANGASEAVLSAIAAVDFNRETGWKAKLLRTDKGKVKSLLENASIAFRHAPEWEGSIAFDEFRQRVRVVRECPIAGDVPRDWTDADDTNATKWLQRNGVEVGVEMAGREIWAVAWENRFNPLRDWLESLHWDGTKRVDTWLFDYLGARKSEHENSVTYISAVGRMWLVSGVARVMRPGEKVDTMLVLEGEQGAGKSRALRILAGDAFFCDSMPDIHSKDAQIQTFGSWIIEFSELDAMSRAETSAVKAFISRQEEKLRRPYGRQNEIVPRQCVFAGTTNTRDYLRDETGNRRFWPVECGLIDCDRLAEDREQLWAEAVELYRERAKWWIENPGVLDAAVEEQMARFQSDPWQDAIAKYTANCGAVKCEDILEHLGRKLADMTQADRNRVGRCLKVLGFKSKYTRTMGRCYVKEAK